jgi:excisionase family DNA binding protein
LERDRTSLAQPCRNQGDQHQDRFPGRRVDTIKHVFAMATLNVSRQYLVRLVDNGRLPAVKVGSYRRLRASDVETFRAARDRDRQVSLDRLVALSEDAGGYGLEPTKATDAA